MSNTHLRLVEALQTADNWRRTDTTMFTAHTYQPDGTTVTSSWTVAELGDYDPYLPKLLAAMNDHILRATPFAYVDGGYLIESLRLQNVGSLTIQDNLGTTHTISQVHAIQQEAAKKTSSTKPGDPYWLDVHTVIVKSVIVDNESLHFVLRRKRTDIVVYPIALDSALSGWKQRWELGGDLGIEQPQLMDFVFFDKGPSQNAIPLIDINFE